MHYNANTYWRTSQVRVYITITLFYPTQPKDILEAPSITFIPQWKQLFQDKVSCSSFSEEGSSVYSDLRSVGLITSFS